MTMFYRLHHSISRSRSRRRFKFGSIARCYLLILLSCSMLNAATVTVSTPTANQWRIENDYLARVITVNDGILRTTALINKRAGTTAEPSPCDEFAVRLSQGTATTDTDVTVTTAGFRCSGVEPYVPSGDNGTRGLVCRLECAPHHLRVEVHYELAEHDFYPHERTRRVLCVWRHAYDPAPTT